MTLSSGLGKFITTSPNFFLQQMKMETVTWIKIWVVKGKLNNLFPFLEILNQCTLMGSIIMYKASVYMKSWSIKTSPKTAKKCQNFTYFSLYPWHTLLNTPDSNSYQACHELPPASLHSVPTLSPNRLYSFKLTKHTHTQAIISSLYSL